MLEDDAEMREEEWGEVSGDFHVGGDFVLKLHIIVLKCAFTQRRATVPSVTSARPITTCPEVNMVRRQFALLVLALATFAAVACTSPTAPKNGCAVQAGSGVCLR
jgi:hypothetical protein